MNPATSKAGDGPERRPARRIRMAWHRRVGLSFGGIFLLVAISGIALNHSLRLDLHNRPIEADWLYRWYGMQPEDDPIAFSLGAGQVAVGLSGSLYLDDQAIAGLGELRGAVGLGEVWVAAGPREMFLFTRTGERVERFDSASLPPGELRSLGLTGEPADPRLALLMSSGRYRFDRDLVDWTTLDPSVTVEVTVPAPLSADLEDRIIRSYRGDGLSVYRILLDLHSGRFIGSIGVVAVTLSAAAMVFLTLTGTAYALRRQRRKYPDRSSRGNAPDPAS
ncbi:MAG: PepSY domain-containing protein [Opitutaceae bacterium]